MFFRMTVWEEGEYDWDYNRQGLFKSGDMWFHQLQYSRFVISCCYKLPPGARADPKPLKEFSNLTCVLRVAAIEPGCFFSVGRVKLSFYGPVFKEILKERNWEKFLYVEESEEELCFMCFDELEKLLNFLYIWFSDLRRCLWVQNSVKFGLLRILKKDSNFCWLLVVCSSRFFWRWCESRLRFYVNEVPQSAFSCYCSTIQTE
jgi:hypothetical protein